MRINHKVLSIPPYISTSWKNILSIQSSETNSILITLQDGSSVTVKDLSPEILNAIFMEHAKHVEQDGSNSLTSIATAKITEVGDRLFDLTNFRSMLEHNQQESNSPDLPKPLLQKIAKLTQTMGLGSFQTLPIPEPHCNCPHCQIARSMRTALKNEDSTEEEILPEDLSFRSWIIEQVNQSTYKAIHPDNSKEEYLVSLQSPIGCTCGSNQCEHIQAVLKS